MQFELTKEQTFLQRSLREFARDEIAPGAADRDAGGRFPHELIPKLAQMGLLGIAIPEPYGGAGLASMELAIALEEVARVDGATALIVASHNSLCTGHIYTFGTEAQRVRYVSRLASGEVLGAWGLTEAGSGSDASALQTRATPDGGDWVLRGAKLFTTQGSTAGVYVIIASTDPEKGKEGLSAFIVERGTPGLMVGKLEDKLGVRASDTAALHFENLRIPRENLLGELHGAFRQVLKILDGGRIGIAAMGVGLARGALEESIRYARQRRQFGRPIADFEAVQWKLADMATEIDAARLLVYRAPISGIRAGLTGGRLPRRNSSRRKPPCGRRPKPSKFSGDPVISRTIPWSVISGMPSSARSEKGPLKFSGWSLPESCFDDPCRSDTAR